MSVKSQIQAIKENFSNQQTPFIAIDLSIVKKQYQKLKSGLPFAKVYYAIKANPSIEILKLLNDVGSNFDIASRYELDRVLSLKISPDRLSYGNTIKKSEDIKYFYDKGIRLFVSDSYEDLLKISKNAPNSKVFFRLFMDNAGADWPLSKKFGAHPEDILKLIFKCEKLNLIPYGISFHVGSQQRDIGQWDSALWICKNIFDECKRNNIELKMINLGGGLPSNYIVKTNSINIYFSQIKTYIHKYFGKNMPEILIEPGRYMTADAGMVVASVILNTKKFKTDLYQWLYLDIGKFGGLIETLDECIKYPIYTEKSGKKSDMIIAGPTCDSFDILYEHNKYYLPVSLKEGDKVYIGNTGAYTASYCAVEFNGFPPIRTYFY